MFLKKKLFLLPFAVVIALSGCGWNRDASQAAPSESAVPYLTSENFEREIFESDLPILVDFTATWCAPCREVDPIVESLASEMEGRARIVKVDIDDSPDIYQQLRINGVPTVVFFNDGVEEDRITSPQTRETYVAYLEAMIDGQSARGAGLTLLDDDAFRRHFIVSREVDAVAEALKERPDLLTEPFQNGQTPLSLILNTPSVRQNDLVDLVLEQNPTIAPAHLTGLGRCDELKAAIASDPEVASRPDPDGVTPLYTALTRAHRLDNGGCLQTLLDSGADPSRDQNERYSLNWAVILTKDVGLLQDLLDRGMNPAATNAEGMNALHFAAVYGLVDTARLLLRFGVDARVRNDKGQTAGDVARERRDSVVELLAGDVSEELESYYADRIQGLNALVAMLDAAGP